jgi:hypothetical protein
MSEIPHDSGSLPPDWNPLVPIRHPSRVPPDMLVWKDGRWWITARDLLLIDGIGKEEMEKIDRERQKRGLEPLFGD